MGSVIPVENQTMSSVSAGSGNTYPKSIYAPILDGVAGSLALRTSATLLKTLFSDLAPGSLLTTDMTKVQAPIYGAPIAAAGAPTWHLTRTSLTAVAYNPTQDSTTKTIAGTAGTSGSSDGTGSAARFNTPNGICFDASGNLIVCDRLNKSIRKVTIYGVVTTVSADSGIHQPQQPVTDATGNIYFSDASWNRICKISTAGVFSALNQGVCDGGGNYDGIALDAAGNIYVNHDGRIHKLAPPSFRRVDLAGKANSYGTADGTGSAARFSSDMDNLFYRKSTGDLFVADTGNHTIRKITSAGVVTTYAGVAGTSGSRDGVTSWAAGGGTLALLNTPRGLVMDADGYMYVTCHGDHTIKQISPTGVVTTIAGRAGTSGSTNGIGTAALFNQPDGIALHPTTGDLWVADSANHVVRVIPNPRPAAVSDYALIASYNGEALPAMSSGAIPAGWQAFLTSWGAREGSQRSGFSMKAGIGPRNVYFVPYFKVAVASDSVVSLGTGDYSWTLSFSKPLNSNQNPTAVLTITSGGTTYALAPTWVKNSAKQITGLTVTIPAARLPSTGASGTFKVTITENMTYLKGSKMTSEVVTHLDASYVRTFVASTGTVPTISAARILDQTEVASANQATTLQAYNVPATGEWMVSERIQVRFSAKAMETNASLARMELWWQRSADARQGVYKMVDGTWRTVESTSAAKAMPTKLLVSEAFDTGTAEVLNKDVSFNTYDVWPVGVASRGVLLLKVFDNLGNSKSLQVSPPNASLVADGCFLNVGATQNSVETGWSEGTTYEKGTRQTYIVGGPGPETSGSNYPALHPGFITACTVANAGVTTTAPTSVYWKTVPWNCEVTGNWALGTQVLAFTLTTKSGRVVSDTYKWTATGYQPTYTSGSPTHEGPGGGADR